MQAGEGVGEVKAEINVTPLVDVCLVLLIIFMVVTPMLVVRGHPVQLPLTEYPDKRPEQEGQILVSIDQAGTLYLDQKGVPKDVFVNTMTEEFERSRTKQVAIQ